MRSALALRFDLIFQVYYECKNKSESVPSRAEICKSVFWVTFYVRCLSILMCESQPYLVCRCVTACILFVIVIICLFDLC